MREAVRDLDRLLHIQECMNNIQEFVENKTFDEFVADKLLFYVTNSASSNRDIYSRGTSQKNKRVKNQGQLRGCL